MSSDTSSELKPASWPRIRRTLWGLRFVFVQVAVLLAAVWLVLPLRQVASLPDPPLPPYTPEPPDMQETTVLGPTTFTPRTQGAVRVIVYDPRSEQPIPGVAVRVSLAPRDHPDGGQPLYAGQTDERGTAEVTFQVPQDAPAEGALVVDTASPTGAQRVVRPVTVRREAALTLVTDKSTYRPGETIHLRLQAFGARDSLPLSEHPVTFTVTDARGNQLWTAARATSDYGIAHADLALADIVNTGTYRILATLGEETIERTVTVEPYAWPRFQVSLAMERPYYPPGERVAGAVRATHWFGKPLAGAQVEIQAAAYPSETHPVWSALGNTDEDGLFAFEFELDQGVDRFALHLIARVTDETGGAETGEILLPISPQPVLIEAAAEGSALKPGIDNVIEIHTTYPGGLPAECTLALEMPGLDKAQTVQTDASGRAEYLYRPPAGGAVTLTVVARDRAGQQGRGDFKLPVAPGSVHVLLRPDREVYHPGEAMHIDVYAPGASQAIYLDVMQGGEAVAVLAAPVGDGHAAFDLEVPLGRGEALELHAYTIQPDGTMVRDIRRVAIESAPGLEMTVQADREQTVSGDEARIALRVADTQGVRRQSAVGVAAVQVQRGTPPLPLYRPPACEALAGTGPLERVDCAAQAAAPPADLQPQHAGIVSRPRPMPDPVRRQFDTVEAARSRRRRAFTLLAERLIWALNGIPVLLWIIVLARARGRETSDTPMRAWGQGCLAGTIVLPLTVGGSFLLTYLGRELFGPGAVIVLAMSWFGVLLALLVRALGRREGWTQLLLATVIASLILAAGMGYAGVQGGETNPSRIVAALGALGAALLAIYVLGWQWLGQGERSAAAAAFALIPLLTVTIASTMLGGTGIEKAQAIQEQDTRSTRAAATATPAPIQLDTPLPALQAAPLPEPPLPRQPLRETLYWDPETVTDPQGRLTFAVSLPEPVEAWELWAVASTTDGEIGAGQARLEVPASIVFKPDLPPLLTVGDELDLPIAVYNVGPISQTVQVTAALSSWFRVRTRGLRAQEITVPANDVGTLYLPIQVQEWGDHVLELVARGAELSDTLAFPVAVSPDGDLISRVYSWWVEDQTRTRFRVPWSAIQGTDRVTVKLYPDRSSVLAEGLEGAMRFSGGSLQEVTARAMADTLLARYLRQAGQWTDETQAQLERSAARHYQRILAFETAEGGFSAFGAGAPDLTLSAHVLRCLSGLADLYPVDQRLLDRTALWLLAQQSPEGTWQLETIPAAWAALPRAELPLTAHITWALIDAGYGHLPGVESAVEHLERYLDKAQDPYALALAINALQAYGREGDALDAALATLAETAVVQDGLAAWPGEIETLDGSAKGSESAYGTLTPSARVEGTALATRALLYARTHPELVAQGLELLTDSRDASGTWNAPQATLLALRTLLDALQGGDLSSESTVRVTVDEIAAQPVSLDAGHAGTVQVLTFDQLSKGYNDIVIQAEGDKVAYQAIGTYYLPWSQIAPTSPEEEEVSIEISYEPTSLHVGEIATATVGIMLNRQGSAPLTVLELGLPPGMDLLTSDLDELAAKGVIAHYEQRPGHVRVYVRDLSAEQPASFRYRLRARFPLSAKTQPTRAYDLANPQRPAVREPAQIEVVP